MILFYKVGYYILEEEIKKIIKYKESIQNNININTNTSGKKIIKKKKKKKKKKSQDMPNPIKKRKISFNTSRKVSFKDNLKTSQYDLKNSNVLINSEKVYDNNINIYKKNEKFNAKGGKPNIKTMMIYDCELNSFSYEEALEFDKRTYFKYYLSLLKTKHPILFSFVPINDYNIIIIKLSLFLLSFIIYFSINTLFFTDSTIHQIYKDQGFYYIKHQILKIIVSFIISHIICLFIKFFSLSERNILKYKYDMFLDKEESDKADELKKCLKIKYTFYYLVSVIFIILFWYYLSSFCSVYKNSQIYLITNTIICVCISFIYPFIINLIPGIFRLISLNSKKKFLFVISKIIQTF